MRSRNLVGGLVGLAALGTYFGSQNDEWLSSTNRENTVAEVRERKSLTDKAGKINYSNSAGDDVARAFLTSNIDNLIGAYETAISEGRGGSIAQEKIVAFQNLRDYINPSAPESQKFSMEKALEIFDQIVGEEKLYGQYFVTIEAEDLDNLIKVYGEN